MENSFKKRFFIRLAEYLIFALMWLIYLTCKKEWLGKPVPKDESVVILFWHGKIALMPFVFKRWWGKKKAKVMISDHKDGEIITRVIRHFNIGAIRGSTSKGAARVLLAALRELKEGTDIFITPDGPRGPRHSISQGSVIIPQKSNSRVIILDYSASKYWQFKSWDKMILPKPFSTITYKISEPFKIDNLTFDEAKKILIQKMSV